MNHIREGGFLLAKIHYLSGRILAEMLRENRIEINPAQGRIMYVLWQEDHIPIKVLAQRTALKKTTLSSMLKRLEKLGYINRKYVEDDRRSILISRSDKDRAWEETYKEVSIRMTEIFYQDFTNEEMNQFENFLRRILNNLETQSSPITFKNINK
jgi:DNA-binding MarR family transcriptional regulator